MRRLKLILPTNRIVTFLGPTIALVATAVATWLVAKVNVLAIPGLDQANVQTYVAAGLTALLGAALHALGGWGWLKGHHILIGEDADETDSLVPLDKLHEQPAQPDKDDQERLA